MSKADFSDYLTATVPIKIPFFDLDPAGVVWHGRYFQYFELARCQLLERLAYSYREMEASGLLWPVTDASVRYLRPLVLDQTAKVTACLREWELRIVMDYRIEAADGVLLTRGRTVQVPVTAGTLELTLGAPQAFIDAVTRQMSDERNPDQSQLRTLIGAPASRFVKHREPMLFLDRLLDIGSDFAVCEWQVDANSPLLLENLGVPAYFGVEYMAQCVAVHSGACAHCRGAEPPLGLLLGTREFTSEVQYFDVNARYRTRCEEVVRDAQGMGSFACHIECDGKILANANLAVLELKGNLDTL